MNPRPNPASLLSDEGGRGASVISARRRREAAPQAGRRGHRDSPGPWESIQWGPREHVCSPGIADRTDQAADLLSQTVQTFTRNPTLIVHVDVF